VPEQRLTRRDFIKLATVAGLAIASGITVGATGLRKAVYGSKMLLLLLLLIFIFEVADALVRAYEPKMGLWL
jgi:hypothetical protein